MPTTAMSGRNSLIFDMEDESPSFFEGLFFSAGVVSVKNGFVMLFCALGVDDENKKEMTDLIDENTLFCGLGFITLLSNWPMFLGIVISGTRWSINPVLPLVVSAPTLECLT